MADGLLGAAEVRALTAGLHLRPTKTLGQNFVHDANTIRRIVAAADLTAADVALEVGPGLGSLTLGLLPACAAVVAVEIDPRLAQALPATTQRHLPSYADRLTVIEADAARVTALPQEPTALIANLPYNVAVPVLLHLLERVPTIRHGLVLVQKEVADRLTAGPGSRVYGIPSVKLAWYAEVRPAGTVPRSVFWPAPNVDSGLVAFTRRPPPAGDRQAVFDVVDAAFSQRRKTLRAALARWAGSPDGAEQILRTAGIDPRRRGETLDVGEFADIALSDGRIGQTGTAP